MKSGWEEGPQLKAPWSWSASRGPGCVGVRMRVKANLSKEGGLHPVGCQAGLPARPRSPLSSELISTEMEQNVLPDVLLTAEAQWSWSPNQKAAKQWKRYLVWSKAVMRLDVSVSLGTGPGADDHRNSWWMSIMTFSSSCAGWQLFTFTLNTIQEV